MGAALSCADSEPLVEPKEPQKDVVAPLTWDCDVYDCGDDPAPDSGGVYVGDGINPKECALTLRWSDTDQDGIADPCERELARAFAPLMRADGSDDPRGEAYWAVRPRIDGYRIAYLLGYYWDFGDDDWYCDTNGHPWCLPHIGDSEWVAIDIEYNRNSKHWLMVGATLSAHWNTINDRTDYVPWYGFTFPTNERAHPLIWVSRGKHANYESVAACESGSDVFDDDCQHSSFDDWRVEVVSNRNIGSRSVPAPNSPGISAPAGTCRYSAENFASNGIYECFWLDGGVYEFNGWQSSNDDVSPYEPQLEYLGF